VIGVDNKRRVWLASLLLAFGTFALYWPVRHYEFVQYDDDAYVFNNPTVRDGLTSWGLVWSLVDSHASNWHPLTWLSHMLDCELFGLNAGAHHLVNVLWHCVNVALLFCVLLLMTGRFGRSVAVAALFAVHPLRVESVAWISERKDVLSGFFFLLTLWAYVRYARQQDGSTIKSSLAFPRSMFHRLALVFFALGLLAKPMLVTVPFILLLLDVWPLNRLGWANANGFQFDKTPFSKTGGLLKEKLMFFVLSAIMGLITIWAQGKAVASVHSLSILSRIENSLVNYASYLTKSFWPHDLAVLYLRPQTLPSSTVILSVILLLAVSTLALLSLRRRPYLMVGWLWFVGMLIPVCGLMQTGPQSIADRYTYLPSIGLSVALVWTLCDLARQDRPVILKQTLLSGAAVLLVGVCAVLTHRQLAHWRNTETLMGRVLEIDPNNYIAHGNLGVCLSKQGRTPEALFHYQRARELDPDLRGATTNTNGGK
jgi:hypothetical protein